MLLVTTPCAFVLSFCMGVGGYLFPISSRDWIAGMASLQLTNSGPSSASDADDITALNILTIVNAATLLGGNVVFLDIKKCPPALLLAFVSERYEASLWPASNISLAWYARTASG